MIVKNEAEKLPRCLACASPWVDEIVVVDTGSTDDTVAIAESFGAKVLHFTWCDDFAAARNVSLEAATCRWALVLDADEEFIVRNPATWQALKEGDGFHAWIIDLVNLRDGGDTDNVAVVRFFDLLAPGVRFEGHLHEQVRFAPELEPRYQHAGSGIQIRHDGYLSDRVQARDKVTRNIRLARMRVAARPNDAHAWWALGDSLVATSPEEGLEALQHARLLLDEANAGPSFFNAHVHVSLIGLLRRRQAPLDAWAACQAGLVQFPDQPDLLLQAGWCRLELEDPGGAEHHFEAALRALASGRRHFQGHRAMLCDASVGKAMAALGLGRLHDAARKLTECLEMEPPNPALVHGTLGDTYAMCDRWDEALRSYMKAFELDAGQPRWLLSVLDGFAVLGRQAQAITLVERLPASPLRDLAKVRALLNGGMAAEALDAEPDQSRSEHSLQGLYLRWWAGDVGPDTWTRAMQEEGYNRPTREVIELLWFGLSEAAPPPSALAVQPLHQLPLAHWCRWMIASHRFDEVQRLTELWPLLGQPRATMLLKVLARELARSGYEDIALPWLLEAHRADPEDVATLYWLGWVAAAQGQPEDALTFWRHALQQEPEARAVQRAIELTLAGAHAHRAG
jgi:tetratricopeptide (TPR) repeat protein